MDYFVHETAVVDQGCRIGQGTKIWHFCHLMPKAEIGENSSLGQNVFVASHVIIGNNNKVQNNVSLFEGVTTEDNVFIGPSAVFTNVINPRSAVSRKDEYKFTLIKQGASIGANATILCGITIGAHAFIGAGAVITKDVNDFELIIGNPGKATGWMSKNGQNLNFDSTGIAICPVGKDSYQLEDGNCRSII